MEDWSQAVYDACVVGSGPAGLVAANGLASRGLRVAIVEAGRGHSDIIANAVSVRGSGDHIGLSRGRAYGLGGTSQIWGGQLWAWAPSEIALRSGVGLPAWPIPFAELASAYEEVAQVFPLTRAQREMLLSPSRLGVGSNDRYSTWIPRRSRNLMRSIGRGLAQRANVYWHLGQRASSVEVRSGHAQQLVVMDEGGHQGHIKAKYYILAAGTVENVRLLHLSELSPNWLGRGMTDHLSAPVVELSVSDGDAFRRAAFVKYIGTARFTRRVIPHENALAAGLPLAYGHLEVVRAPSTPKKKPVDFAPFPAAPSNAPHNHSGPGGAGRAMRVIERVAAEALLCAGAPRAGLRLRARVDFEQLPGARLVWKRGSGRLKYDWAVRDGDMKAYKAFASYFRDPATWAPYGLRVVRPIPDSGPTDMIHMSGGTRMSVDPADGVVDPYGRVHSVANLFIAGASTFPSSGMANPTFTACALAHRSAIRITDGC